MLRLPSRVGVLGEVFRSRQLRRLELSWAGFFAGEWAHFVAVSVYAYDQGGATLVGIFGVLRMLAAAAGSLVGSLLADRRARQRVLLGIHLGRAAALAAAAGVLATGGPVAVVFALAALASFFGGPYRPTHLALLPVLARTPQELVAVNVSSNSFQGIAILVGPAVAGGVLAVSGPDVVLGISAAVFLWSALLVARIGLEPGWQPARLAAGSSPLGELLAGFGTLRRDSRPRLVIGLFAAQSFVRGLLNVLLVSASLTVLGSGNPGVGYLNSSLGLGSLVGGLAAVVLVGRRRLAGPFSLGLVLWGAPIAAIAGWPVLGWALFAVAVVGAGNALLNVAGYTLIQRTVDDLVLGRALGVCELLVSVATASGSIVAPVLIHELGLRASLVVTGLILPALAAVFHPGLRRIDNSVTVPVGELKLLSRLPIFAPLAVTSLEKLAGHLRPVRASAGTEVVRQGDPGDLFYLIVQGEVEVVHDGQRVAILGPGQYFGEIALLHDVPRVATCRSLTDLELFALKRDVFVAAVTGHVRSTTTAEATMARRLSELDHIAPRPSAG